jgi:hypothetical protein
MAERPHTVTVVGWLFIAAGVVGVVYHAPELLTDGLVESSLVLLVRVLAFAGGVAALRGVNWSRWLLVGWVAFQVSISMGDSAALIAHGVLLIVVAYTLFTGAASRYFDRARAA